MRLLVERDHRPWAQLVAKRMPQGCSAPVIVELAAGPGFLLLELGALVPGASLIAVDDAAAMIGIQAEEARSAGRELRSVCAPAQATGLPGASADVVLCKNLLNCIEAQAVRQAVVHEACRLLRPGGLAAFIDFDDAGPSVIASALTAYIRFRAGRQFAQDFADAWKRRLDARALLRTVQRAGLQDTWYHRRMVTFLIEGRAPDAEA